MKTPIWSKGFTILETLIVVAIAGVAMAGVTAMIELISSGTAGQKFSYESHDMTEEIRTTLGDPNACLSTFQGLATNSIPTAMPNKLDFPGPVKDKSGSVNVYEIGKIYFNSLKIRDMFLTNYLFTPPNSGTFSLFMDFDALTKVSGSNSILSQTNISFTTDGSGNLASCVALSRATDGLWKITTGTNTNIYFADGNVGIGIPSAIYPFQVQQSSGVTQLDTANFGATGAFTSVGVNNLSSTASQRGALIFQKNKVGLFEIGTDYGGLGAQNFYVQDDKANQVRMILDATGKLGLGTATPHSRIHVESGTARVTLNSTAAGGQSGLSLVAVGTSGSATASFTNDGGVMHLESNIPVAINKTTAQFMSLNAGGGAVGIGTTTMLSPLTITCPAGNCVSASIGSDSGSWFTFVTAPFVARFSINYEMVRGLYRAVVFRNRGAGPGADRWWMTYSVANQGNGPSDSVHFFGGTEQSGGEELVLDNGNISVTNGVVWAGGTCVSGPCLSDIRLKENVRPFEPGLKALLEFNPVYYRYNGLGGTKKSERDMIGVIAQDVEKGAPEVVNKKKVTLRVGDAVETEIKRVEYGSLIYVVINGVKELYRELSGIKSEVDALKKQNDELKRYICGKDSTAEFCP